MSTVLGNAYLLSVAPRLPSDPPRLVLVTPPAAEVFTSADAVVQQALKLDSTLTDGTYVDLLLKSARVYFERLTGLALITQTWRATYDRLPLSAGFYPLQNSVELPKAPLIALTIVAYLDVNGAPQTATLADYAAGNVGCATAFGRARLKDTASWPELGTDPGAISFTFTAGFGTTAASVPEEVRSALLMLSAHWYQNRLPILEAGRAASAFPLPLHLTSLLELCSISALF